MATSTQATVTAAPAAIIATPTKENINSDTRRYLIKAAAAGVYIGPPGVAASTGYLLTQNYEYEVNLRPSEEIHGVTASGTATVYVWGP